MTIEEMWNNISMRAKEKKYQVDFANENDCIELLEAKNTVYAHNKLLLIKEEYLQEHGKTNYDDILIIWKKWYKESFSPRTMKRIKENRVEEEK